MHTHTHTSLQSRCFSCLSGSTDQVDGQRFLPYSERSGSSVYMKNYLLYLVTVAVTGHCCVPPYGTIGLYFSCRYHNWYFSMRLLWADKPSIRPFTIDEIRLKVQGHSALNFCTKIKPNPYLYMFWSGVLSTLYLNATLLLMHAEKCRWMWSCSAKLSLSDWRLL